MLLFMELCFNNHYVHKCNFVLSFRIVVAHGPQFLHHAMSEKAEQRLFRARKPESTVQGLKKGPVSPNFLLFTSNPRLFYCERNSMPF